MEISRDNIILSIIDKNIALENELYIKIYNKNADWTELEFNNYIGVMKSLNFKEVIEKEYLEVNSYEENILVIYGLTNILKYCVNDNHKNLNYKWIKRDILSNDNVEEFLDADINFKTIKDNLVGEIDNWDELRKKYRIIKTIKYIDNNKNEYIANIVKEKDDEFYTLKQSGVIKSNQSYEFYVNIKEKNKENIISSILRMVQSVSLSSIILSKPQQKKVLDDYYSLIKNDVVVRGFNKTDEYPLITPKPITLEKINLINPDEYGAVSILSEYTVTEKADGERLLLYINDIGRVYLINNSYRVEDTGIIAKKKDIHNSLIDGEYILCNKRIDTTKKSIYASFDIYYIGGKKITNLPLLDKTKNNRYEKLKSLEELLDTKDSAIEFIVKEHYLSNNILNDCKRILSDGKKYPYEIDGLIFTPAKLALYSYYTNKPVQLTDNMKWDRVFKWKPIEQNTIDFLIKEGKTLMIEGQKYKEMKLYVGYNSSQWEEISPIEGLKLKYDKTYANKTKQDRIKYVPKLFKPTIYYSPGVEIAYIPINSKGDLRAENNDKIETESIVEFKYINDKNIPINQRWKALRVREDKTRIYKQGKLSKTANELGVAINIWRSIHNPVSQSMIVGNEPVFPKISEDDINENLLDTDDIYYSRDIPRESLLSINMLNFHNQGIKKTLYDTPKKKGTLLELACGQGGDMNRWIDSKYRFVLGVDLVKNNIYNPRSGAYSRMLKRRYNYQKKIEGEVDKNTYIDMVFAVGDCGVQIKNGQASLVVNDKESEKVLQIVMNNQRYVDNHFKYIAGKGSNGFDVVSCMFAIHYFFQDEEKLNGFLNNVSSNLKKGGMFICTFMDGKKVEEEIMNNDGDKIEGRKLKEETEKGVPVWAIIRRFTKNSENLYNRKVDVYIENTQKLIPEYLVNYNLLIEKAKEHNLEIHSSEMFGESFNKLKEKITEIKEEQSKLDEDILLLDKDIIQKQFSFLNRWCIFKKI